jgi:hypothetical protein
MSAIPSPTIRSGQADRVKAVTKPAAIIARFARTSLRADRNPRRVRTVGAGNRGENEAAPRDRGRIPLCGVSSFQAIRGHSGPESFFFGEQLLLFGAQHAVTFGVGNAFTCKASVQIESLAIDLRGNPMKFLSFFVISLSALIFTAKAVCDEKVAAWFMGTVGTCAKASASITPFFWETVARNEQGIGRVSGAQKRTVLGERLSIIKS